MTRPAVSRRPVALIAFIRLAVATLALATLVVALAPWWRPALGAWLEVRDPLAPADVIVVLAGNAPDRLRHAAALYQAGYAPRLVISDENVRTHGMDRTWGDLFRAGVAAPYLPRDAVILVDPVPESTIDEAQRTARILADNGWRSAILVTDPFHSRRASLLFAAEYRRLGLRVLSSPVERPTLDLSRWWLDPDDARRVFEEVVKLAAYVPRGAYW